MSDYSPQRHAQSVDVCIDLVQRMARRLDALEVLVQRIAGAVVGETMDARQRPAFDALLHAMYAALGSRSVITSEVLAAALGADSASMDLAHALASVGKSDPRRLGTYLSDSAGAVTADGRLQLLDVGYSGNVKVWSVRALVSNSETPSDGG